MDSYQHSYPTEQDGLLPGITVFEHGETVVMEDRPREGPRRTMKWKLAVILGVLFVAGLAAFGGDNNNSSNVPMLGASNPEMLAAAAAEEADDSPPDIEKTKAEGTYDWQKCKNSDDPDW
jgi:hypothetical protein